MKNIILIVLSLKILLICCNSKPKANSAKRNKLSWSRKSLEKTWKFYQFFWKEFLNLIMCYFRHQVKKKQKYKKNSEPSFLSLSISMITSSSLLEKSSNFIQEDWRKKLKTSWKTLLILWTSNLARTSQYRDVTFVPLIPWCSFHKQMIQWKCLKNLKNFVKIFWLTLIATTKIYKTAQDNFN